MLRGGKRERITDELEHKTIQVLVFLMLVMDHRFIFFSYGEKGNASYACLQQWVSLVELKDEKIDVFEPIYDDNVEKNKEVDVYPVQR